MKHCMLFACTASSTDADSTAAFNSGMPAMHYTLLGFTQQGSIRRFSFQRVSGPNERVRFDVSADLTLARKWNISVQQLPALCTALLQTEAAIGPAAGLSLTEADLSAAALTNEAAAAERAEVQAARSRRAALSSRSVAARSNPPADAGLSEPRTRLSGANDGND